MEQNFKGLFFGGSEVKCPYCQLKFESINQLKLHKQTYCATNEHYDLVTEMFMKYAEDLRKAGTASSAAERSVAILKGLYKLKAEFDLYQSYIDNPKINILNQQKEKKLKEANTKVTNFTAMFSDFNSDGSQTKEYPFLQAHLENTYGEELSAFVRQGEKTSADDVPQNLPSWMANKVTKKQVEVDSTKYMDDITREMVNKVVAQRVEGKDALDLLQEDPEYLKLFKVLSKNVAGVDTEDIGLLVREPVSRWEERYFGGESIPTKTLIEGMIREIEQPNDRKNRYVYQMRDLWAIYDAVTGHILTEVDMEKREQLQKLIAEREFMQYRENLFLDDVQLFREMYIKRLDYVMYRLSPNVDLDKAFINLYKKLKYAQ
jgi:hypothetical protein